MVTVNGMRDFAVYKHLSLNNKNHGHKKIMFFTTQDSNVVTHRSARWTNPTDQSHERPTEFFAQ